jgi:hypothetical protein
MTKKEWQELKELAASLGLFVEHPERWEKISNAKYLYLGDLTITFNLSP